VKIQHASRVLTAAIVLLSLLAIACAVVARRSWAVSQEAQEARRQMLRYTDQLADASDRLTEAVRAHAATGDRRYHEEYEREVNVHRNRELAVEGLRRMGLTADELELLTLAKRNSDRLVILENQAFATVERGDVIEAIRIVYGPEYAAAKASIMGPIAECRRSLEMRLTANAARLARRARLLDNTALVTLLLNALSVLAVLFLFYRRRVVDPLVDIGRSLEALIADEQGAAIGHQDDTSEIGEVARSIERYRKTVAELLEQVRASEAELRHTNFLADSALDLTRSGYWHVPLDGSGWYNSSERAERIFGDLPTPDHRHTLEHWSQHVFAGDEAAAIVTMAGFEAAVAGTTAAYDATYAYKRPVDGRVVWIHALGHVVRDADGKPTDMYGVTQDITDFKLLEMELIGARQKAEEATEMKSMFLANMSHEIRTPMNAVIGLSHLALRTQLNAKQRDYLNKIHNAGTSLLAVINDILDFSKIEAGRLEVERTDFRLDDVFDSVITLTAQKAHDKGLELLAQVSAAIPEVLVGDPLRLGQVLTNLVNNAVKFTERGEIRLQAELVDRTGAMCQLRFSVRDTGIGMTSEQTARLFQPFTQADMSTTRKHGGTGLGLTISRRLVELMGGQIWLDSEPGKGSTFAFTVRLEVGEPKGAATVLPERLASLDVLVVDDNPAAREILQDALGTIVRSVSAVASGPEAVAAVRRQDASGPYDVVFLDWQMPDMDGLAAARLIKADPSVTHQPAILLVTAFGRDEVREEAEALGLDGFLLKPVSRSTLVDSLVNVVGAASTEAAAGVEGEWTTIRLPGLRVLLAEDNEINQQIAVELLQATGASVDVASDGREATEKVFGGGGYDLVLMDLQMPEMDGYQATARIRAEPRFANLPIVAMTAHATTEERQRCRDAGMNDHVAKPIDPALLLATLSRYYQREREAPSPPAASGGAAEIPAVDGLDTADGLARVAGNRSLYLKLLRRFLDQEATPARIVEALAAGDWPLAERLAHTCRGVAGNLGARAVMAAAGDLEDALRTRSTAAVLEPLLSHFAAELSAFIGRLEAALPPEAPTSAPQTVPAEEVARLTAAMVGHLEQFDPAAVELFETHRDAFRILLPPNEYSTFAQHVASFAFADALETLNAVVERQEPPLS
jgi:two-component system sensor histidine kinase/response regulator